MMMMMKMASEHCSNNKVTTTYATAEHSKTSRPRRTNSPTAAANTSSMVLLSILAMLYMVTSATAQQGTCSCAPRGYRFKLNFSGTCPPLPPPFPPNDYFGSGVKDYTCSIGDSPVQDSDREQTSTRDPIRRLLEDIGGDNVDETLLQDIFPELGVSTQDIADQMPDVVTSVQFIQQDRKGHPIESTLSTGDKNDGEIVSFISSIVTKPDQIPYRITMILRGTNAAQQSIQNTFTIEFSNACGVPTFTEGEEIGWVIFVSDLVIMFWLVFRLFLSHLL